ncbi:hypothetical protein ACN47E_002421 [Coniothyrium glycines]
MTPNVGLGSQGEIQRGWGLWLTSVLAVIIAGLFVIARIIQRCQKKSGLGTDDYMIIAALVFSVLLTLTECQAVVHGYGRRWATLPRGSRMVARKWFYGANVIYKVVLMFNKISVVCLYNRIFSVSNKTFRVCCHAMNAWILASGLAFIIATIFQCTPIAAFWDRSIVGFKCFKNEPWWISYATTQITTDLVLLAMPVPQILKLSMGRAEKFGLCLIFGTGAFVTFSSIFRATTIAASASDPDPTWGPIPATIWSVIEANIGIVCSCLPMLRGPFLRLFGPLLGARHNRTRRQSYQLSAQAHSTSITAHHKDDIYYSQDFQRSDSEQAIIEDDSTSAHKNDSRSRRGSGIFVTNEFSVVTIEEKRKSQARSEAYDEERHTAEDLHIHI